MGRPSKGRGGPRQATPGTSYPNRSDLATRQPPAFKSVEYGSGVAQQAARAASDPPPASGPLFGGQHPVPPGVPAPGEFPDLFSPTDRPGEPVTHGLPFGAGAGPEVLAKPFTPDPLVQASALLSTLPAVHQTPALQALSRAVSASVANGTQTSVAQGAA